MTEALEGGEWSAARPGHTLPQGKNRYPFCIRLGGPQGRSRRAENLVPTGFQSRTVQLIAQSLCWLSYQAHICTTKIRVKKYWEKLEKLEFIECEKKKKKKENERFIILILFKSTQDHLVLHEFAIRNLYSYWSQFTFLGIYFKRDVLPLLVYMVVFLESKEKRLIESFLYN
jgi:hypothetical protein